jgi:hypothetical protein
LSKKSSSDESGIHIRQSLINQSINNESRNMNQALIDQKNEKSNSRFSVRDAAPAAPRVVAPALPFCRSRCDHRRCLGLRPNSTAYSSEPTARRPSDAALKYDIKTRT